VGQKMTRVVKPKICICLPLAYPRFNSAYLAPFGGLEIRVSLIARELARRGQFKIAFVVGDFGQPHIEEQENITFYSWIGRDLWGVSKTIRCQKDPQYFPLIKKVINRSLRYMEWFASKLRKRNPFTGKVADYPITHSMISIFDEVCADIYIVPGNSIFSAEVAFYCQQRGKKFVFQAGSDYDYYPEYRLHPGKSDIYGTSYALKNISIDQAFAHIVQNEQQAQMLKDGYGRNAIIIKNPIDLTPSFSRNLQPNTILWIGKSDERVKRPSLVLELARQLPEYQFVIIMTVAIKETHDQCMKIASTLPNVTLVEFVPFEQIEQYFANARIHLNTSVFEGFPNTFLQAAKYSVPTVSLQVDPGGMLTEYGCGAFCEGDLEKAKQNITSLMTNNSLCAALGKRSFEYVQEFHDKDKIVQQYEIAIKSILASHEIY
jgi:glycosyltransferase involved in cell wall biosynthesis